MLGRESATLLRKSLQKVRSLVDYGIGVYCDTLREAARVEEACLVGLTRLPIPHGVQVFEDLLLIDRDAEGKLQEMGDLVWFRNLGEGVDAGHAGGDQSMGARLFKLCKASSCPLEKEFGVHQ